MKFKIMGTLLFLLSTTPSMAKVISVKISNDSIDLLTNCKNINRFYKECYVNGSHSFQIDSAIDSYFIEIGDAKIRVDGQIVNTGYEFRVKYNDRIFQLEEGVEISSWVFDYGILSGEKKRLEVLSMGEGRVLFHQSARAYIQSVSIELNRDLLIDEKDKLHNSIIDLNRLIQIGQNNKKFVAVNKLLQTLNNVDEPEISHTEIEEAKEKLLFLMMTLSYLSDDARENLINVYSFVDKIRTSQSINISESDRKLMEEFNTLVSEYEGDEGHVTQIENDRQKKMELESMLLKMEEFLEANP